jgi:hypothetical protein
VRVAHPSLCDTQAPRISGIWPPMFAAMAALNRRNATLSPTAKSDGEWDPPHDRLLHPALPKVMYAKALSESRKSARPKPRGTAAP